MSLFEDRDTLYPVQYPDIYEAYVKVIEQPWSFTQVPLESDVVQWKNNLTEADRRLCNLVFRGFTEAEGDVGCYWSNVGSKHFKCPEVQSLAKSCAAQETIHRFGYGHLVATLGIDISDPDGSYSAAKKKLEYIEECLDDSRENLALSLAVFSGAIEGVSLFASFLILLSFSRDSLLLGMKQILSWSVLDEHNHSETGIALYKKLLLEEPSLAPNQNQVHKAFKEIVNNEIAFVEEAFDGYYSERITKPQVIEYIKYRANDRLLALGFAPLYKINIRLVNEVTQWFHQCVKGLSDNDFFVASKNGQGYQAIVSQDFSKVDVTKFEPPSWLKNAA